MRNILLSITLLFAQNLKSQDLNETVSYINTLLFTSTYKLDFPGDPSPYKEVYDKISVDQHGKLECARYLTNAKTGKTSNGSSFFVYLKSIKLGSKKDYTDFYIADLECIGDKLCFGGIGVEKTAVSFRIKTASNRDRLYNAFAHLLSLAKLNKDFYEKDPFGD